ncbi:MAG TPA: VWA domain-containing protein [Candidatus Acidoferrum sp.]|nr:VWA domain-containing protein [Candidatus Acidoferrum sp.]
MGKSREKRPVWAVAAAGVVMLVTLAGAGVVRAQDPPQAPTPQPDAAAAARKPAAAPSQQAQAPSAAPLSPTGQSDAQAKIVLTVNTVLLPVTVKDSSGNLVPDLTREEFRVFDDNIEQRISLFSVEAFPLSAVLLIDNDLKGKDSEMVESSLKSIVAGLSLSDEAFVCRFDTNFHPGKGFTKDQDKLVTELKRTRLDTETDVVGPDPSGPFGAGATINGQNVAGGPAVAPSTKILRGQPNKALDDAMYEAAALLSDRGRSRRKVIFLISDGKNAKNNKYDYETVVKELLRYNISVYSLAVGSAFLDRKFTRLQSYAHDTGGEVFYAAKQKTLEELYSRVTEQARNQYTLAYSPQGNDKTKDYHAVEVRVRRPGLNIITRQGYYSALISK